jgi:hypothetical protein
MGIIIADRSLIELVQVRRQALGDQHGTDVDNFMEALNQFMADVTEGNDVIILSYAGTIWADEQRLETDAEHIERMAVSREQERKYQAVKNSSWERQKKKFARSRIKK